MTISEIILTCIGIVFTTLVSFGCKLFFTWVNSKIKNEKYKVNVENATDIVENACKTIFQTYVGTLRKQGAFDKDAQVEALNKCKGIIKEQVSNELKSFIEENFGNYDNWLTNTIEKVLFELKENNW